MGPDLFAPYKDMPETPDEAEEFKQAELAELVMDPDRELDVAGDGYDWGAEP